MTLPFNVSDLEVVKTAHKVRLVEAVAQRSYTTLITEQRAFTPFDFMKIYVKFLSYPTALCANGRTSTTTI